MKSACRWNVCCDSADATRTISRSRCSTWRGWRCTVADTSTPSASCTGASVASCLVDCSPAGRGTKSPSGRLRTECMSRHGPPPAQRNCGATLPAGISGRTVSIRFHSGFVNCPRRNSGRSARSNGWLWSSTSANAARASRAARSASAGVALRIADRQRLQRDSPKAKTYAPSKNLPQNLMESSAQLLGHRDSHQIQDASHSLVGAPRVLRF